MEYDQTEDQRPENTDQDDDPEDDGTGERVDKPERPLSPPGANQKEPDAPAEDEPSSQRHQRENHREEQRPKRRTDRSAPDKVIREIQAQILRDFGSSIRVKPAKMTDQGTFAFVKGAVFEYNPKEEYMYDLEARIVETYGLGTYRLTFLPPRGSNSPAPSYSFTYVDSSPVKGNPELQQNTPVGAASNPGGAVRNGSFPGLPEVTKPAANVNERTGDGSGSDASAALVNLATRLIENTVAEQAKKIDKLTAAVESLAQTMAHREQPPQPTAPDLTKSFEVVANTIGSIVEKLMPRVQQQTTPPPTNPTGPGDFDKILLLADRLSRLSEGRQPSPQQPLTFGESFLNGILQLVSDQARQLSQNKPASKTDAFEDVARIITILNESGLNPEGLRRVGQVLEEPEVPAKPNPLFDALQRLFSDFAKSFGASLGTNATALASTLMTPKPPTQGAPPNPNSLQPSKTVYATPVPVVPPTTIVIPPNNAETVKTTAPQPPSEDKAKPATKPLPPVKPTPETEHQSASVPGPGGQDSPPPDQRKHLKPLLGTRPPLTTPGSTQTFAIPEDQFQQIVAALNLPMPADEAARLLLTTFPQEFRQYLTQPLDEAWLKVAPSLTPQQIKIADSMWLRIREVYNALRAQILGPGQKSDNGS